MRQADAGAINQRAHARYQVEIPVTVETVLDRADLTITDISNTGARIEGGSFREGQTISLSFGETIVYGIVRWSEIDRMGVSFLTPLGAKLTDVTAKARILPPPSVPMAGIRPAIFGRRLGA